MLSSHFTSMALLLSFAFSLLVTVTGQPVPPPGFDRTLQILAFTAKNNYPVQSTNIIRGVKLWQNDTNDNGGLVLKTTDGFTFKYYANISYVDIPTTAAATAQAVARAALDGTTLGLKPTYVIAPFGSILTEIVAKETEAQKIVLVSVGASAEVLFVCLFNNTDCNNRGIQEGHRRFKYLHTVIGSSQQMTIAITNFLSLRKVRNSVTIQEEEPYSQTMALGITNNGKDIKMTNHIISTGAFGTTTLARAVDNLNMVKNQYSGIPLWIVMNSFPMCDIYRQALRIVNYYPPMLFWGSCTADSRWYAQTDVEYGVFWGSWDHHSKGLNYIDTKRFPPTDTVSSPDVFYTAFYNVYGYYPGTFESIGYVAPYILEHLFDALVLDSASPITPDLLKSGLQQVYATSYYGRISFDQYGRMSYENNIMFQFQQDRTAQLVAPLSVALVDFIYPAPSFDERVYNPEQYSNTSDKVIAALTACCCLYLIILALLVIKHWNSPSIRTATRSFCLVMLLGGFILLCTNFASTSVQTDSSCTAQVWLYSIGFQLLFTPLFLKTYRLFKIFKQAQKLKIETLTTSVLFMVLAAVIGAEIVYLLGWTLGSGIESTIRVVDVLRPSMNISYCSINIVLTWISVVYKIISVVAGVVLTYICRNLPPTFNESKFIGVAIYNLALGGIIIIPISSSSSIDANSLFVIRSFIIMLVVCAIETILLVPKFRFSNVMASHFDAGKTQGSASAASSYNRSGQESRLSESHASTVSLSTNNTTTAKNTL